MKIRTFRVPSPDRGVTLDRPGGRLRRGWTLRVRGRVWTTVPR